MMKMRIGEKKTKWPSSEKLLTNFVSLDKKIENSKYSKMSGFRLSILEMSKKIKMLGLK